MVSKLEQSTDVDGSCHLSRQILDFLELHATDYRTNQVGSQLTVELIRFGSQLTVELIRFGSQLTVELIRLVVN